MLAATEWHFSITLPGYHPSQVDATEWHYMDSSNQSQGPVSTAQLRELYEDGTLYASTYVWCEEMDSWKELKQAPITL